MRTISGSAWNPGLESDLPREYRELETIYRPENTSTQISEVDEYSEMTGLSPEDLVVFRPLRLVVHEVIVRITADIVVLEGEEEEDLGKNFRRIARRILSEYVYPHMPEIEQAYAELRDRVQALIGEELSQSLFKEEPTRARKRFSLSGLLGRKKPSPIPKESVHDREVRVISAYKERGLAAEDPLARAMFKALYRVLGSMMAKRGYVGSDRALITRLVRDQVCNRYGSAMIGEIVTPYMKEAIEREGYKLIPNSEKSILISLKGASAAGKSSLRPMLKRVKGELGIQPDGYGTISPDIWRRLLLDYESLGEAYKYAGRLTSNEIIIIDSKLDHYFRDKANRNGSIPHLVVDRFRFDSFTSEKVARILHGTYVKYVDTMYMYFIITPPEATVERGWQRGLERGRFKAVDDFLDHSVEAYAGMPKILFKWLAYDRPLFKYEFLDNDVPRGTYPKTIAYGTQNEINIIDPLALIDIERYQRININAKSPEEVYPDASQLSVEKNAGFLKQCIKKIPKVSFINRVSGAVYLRANESTFEIVDANTFAIVLEDKQIAAIFSAIAPRLVAPACG